MSPYLSSPRVWILLICQPYYITLSAHFPVCERSGNADVPHCRCDFLFAMRRSVIRRGSRCAPMPRRRTKRRAIALFSCRSNERGAGRPVPRKRAHRQRDRRLEPPVTNRAKSTAAHCMASCRAFRQRTVILTENI